MINNINIRPLPATLRNAVKLKEVSAKIKSIIANGNESIMRQRITDIATKHPVLFEILTENGGLNIATLEATAHELIQSGQAADEKQAVDIAAVNLRARLQLWAKENPIDAIQLQSLPTDYPQTLDALTAGIDIVRESCNREVLTAEETVLIDGDEFWLDVESQLIAQYCESLLKCI